MRKEQESDFDLIMSVEFIKKSVSVPFISPKLFIARLENGVRRVGAALYISYSCTQHLSLRAQANSG